jgi:hypothetical protein
MPRDNVVLENDKAVTGTEDPESPDINRLHEAVTSESSIASAIPLFALVCRIP